MWKEWINVYNSYNSLKALCHRDGIAKAVEWTDGKTKELPAPITVAVDPTNLCNVNCSWCKYREYRSASATSIPDSRLLEIPSVLKSWGVKAVVVSGGEPLMHPKIAEFLAQLGKEGLSTGLKTNGLLLTKPTIRKAVLTHVKWVGFSVDAATASTYLKIKRAGLQSFEKVLANIKWLANNRKAHNRPRITMKFLIHHVNYGEEYAFCDLAKTLGADEVLIRPVYLQRYRFTRGVRKTAEFYLREARKAFESDSFRVYAIVHKVEREWDRAIRFKKCYATPLGGVFGADGNFYICKDRRGDIAASLGKWHPFEEFLASWGGEEHRNLVERISPQACPKCSLSIINEIVERAILEDEMTLDFI